MSGRLTVWIDGREALPVRAIPYVAGWEALYSPDEIAASLAGIIGEPFARLRGVVAYHLSGSKPLPVVACEWNAVVAALKALEAELHELRPQFDPLEDDAGYGSWRKKSIQELPAGVFVWLDEFLHEREVDRKRRPDDIPVILAPMLNSVNPALLLEGFENCPAHGEEAESAMIGYTDFIAICKVDDLPNVSGYRLEANGLHAVLPDSNTMLTPEERAELPDPPDIYATPVLQLPCTWGQLREFLEERGLVECIDESLVSAILGHQTSVPASDSSGEQPKQAATIRAHRIRTRSNPLDAVIELAAKKAVAPDDSQSVFAEMVKLAESKDRPAPLVGYSSAGIQYRGKKYEDTGEPDTFTLKNLRDRMARAKAR